MIKRLWNLETGLGITMFHSTCGYEASKPDLEFEVENASDEDSSKENSLVNGHGQHVSSAAVIKGSPIAAQGSPWGHTLTPRSGGPALHPQGTPILPQHLVMNNTSQVSEASPKQNVPWNDLRWD